MIIACLFVLNVVVIYVLFVFNVNREMMIVGFRIIDGCVITFTNILGHHIPITVSSTQRHV